MTRAAPSPVAPNCPDPKTSAYHPGVRVRFRSPPVLSEGQDGVNSVVPRTSEPDRSALSGVSYCPVSWTIAPKMSPEDKSSLLLEFFCWENDTEWSADKAELLESSMEWLERFDFIKGEEVMDSYVHHEKHAYPVYDIDYREHLSSVRDYLGRFTNCQCVGRGGSFQYANQDYALEMGMAAARRVIEGKRHGIEEPERGPEYGEGYRMPVREDERDE